MIKTVIKEQLHRGRSEPRTRYVGITHLRLEPGDAMKPCPFCGATEVELKNTHTACYWIECTQCNAEVHGEAEGTDLQSPQIPLRLHRRAKASAIRAWNKRANVEDRSSVAAVDALLAAHKTDARYLHGEGWLLERFTPAGEAHAPTLAAALGRLGVKL